MRLGIALFLCFVGGCLNTGCSLPANPRTEFGIGPFSSVFKFHDSKDNDIEIVGAVFDPATNTFKVDKLTIRNNASDPRRANVEQIQAYTEQVKAMTAMVTQMTQAIAAAVPWSRSAPASQPSP